MGGRIWSRVGSICHRLESNIGSLYRGELALLLYSAIMIEQLFGIAYIVALVGLPAQRRQRDIAQTISPDSSEKALTGTRVQE